MDLWSQIRERIALRAYRARPTGQITADRPAVRRVDGGAPQGWDDNALFEDISGVGLIGVDAVIGSAQFTVE